MIFSNLSIGKICKTVSAHAAGCHRKKKDLKPSISDPLNKSHTRKTLPVFTLGYSHIHKENKAWWLPRLL